MNDPTRVAHVKVEAQRLASENKYEILATPWLAFPLERAYAMQRMDKFMLNIGRHPEFARALVCQDRRAMQNPDGTFPPRMWRQHRYNRNWG